MAKATLSFALYHGGALVRRETVAQDIVKVGRDPKSHLHIDDEQAARMHAVIEVASPDDITLIDLGNDPGTAVNGAQVSKCKLKAGDQIEIGGTRIVLENATADAPHAAAAANPFSAPAPAANPFAAAPAASSNPFAAGGSSNPFAAGGSSNPFASGGGMFEFQSANPFAAAAALTPEMASAQALAVPDDAPPGTYTFRLLKSGPDVNPKEVELANVSSVEVMVLWGTNVLHVKHLTPPRDFIVADGESRGPKDFAIPAEKLGMERYPVVVGGRQGVSVVIPAGAKGSAELPEGDSVKRLTIDEARARGVSSSACPGGTELALPRGAKATVEIGDFVFRVSTVAAGKPVGVGGAWDMDILPYFGGTIAVVGGFVLAMFFANPDASLSQDQDIDKNQLLTIQSYLKAAAEREKEEKPTEEIAKTQADNKEGGTGTRAKGEEGSMGNPNSKATNKRYAVKGPADNPDPHIARAAAIREAQEFGMIGLLNSGGMGDPNAPTAEWGRDTSLGRDEVSARGNMWGDEIGDAFGAGGLGLSGIGEGGGGRGEGIGLGTIGGLGHGAGTGTGQGFGSGHGRLSGSHSTKTPQVRPGATTVSGRLPPEVIQRIVRQNFGRFTMCYQRGLSANPNLEGRVSVRFLISTEGTVTSASNAGSDLPDGGVVGCVVSAFFGLSFPKPEGGTVSVVYPIALSPG